MANDAAEIVAYVFPGWEPRIRPASQRREWMDASPESFPYRCLPLKIANSHGWEILAPMGFTAIWNGGPASGDVTILPDRPAAQDDSPVALFGQGVVTFHIQAIFRTPPGWDLWVSGPPNMAKDGIAPLTGLIETDWSPYSFTMNWRFTRPGHAVRFEENEPICFLFPIQRSTVERFEARIAPIEEEKGLREQYEAWSRSRLAFQRALADHPAATPADKWQKLYYRGLDPEGREVAPDHRTRVAVCPFTGLPAPRKPDL